jgi:electron transfer flavoprotein beta subunit
LQILVFVKPSPEPESRLRPSSDGTRFDPEGIRWVLAGYDESAVEQALLLREANPPSEVRAVSFGPPPGAEEALRAALALGCDAATWVEAPPGAVPDLRTTVRALAEAARSHPADLCLLGVQSLDAESGTVPLALATSLGRPGASAATKLRFLPPAKAFSFERAVEGGVESWTLPAPAVLGLKQADNDPRSARLQNILKSRKMPIERVPAPPSPSGEGPAVRATQFSLPPPRSGARLLSYESPEDAAQKLVRVLREEAKVFP